MTIQEKAAQMVARVRIITLASIDEDGYPRPVPMVKLSQTEKGDIYTSTGTNTAKAAHFKANPKAGMSIMEDGNCVVYTGEVEIVEDMDIKRSLWSDWMKEHMKQGVEDPEYCLLKFTPRSAVYYIDNEFIKE